MSLLAVLILLDAFLINAGYLMAFLMRYGLPFPAHNFFAYKSSCIYLTIIHIATLAFFGVYKKRFRSSWELARTVFSGLSISSLLSIVFIYIFRVRWDMFPTSVFLISFFVNLILIFKCNQLLLKFKNRIKKKILIVGEDDTDDIVTGKMEVERIRFENFHRISNYPDIDEIVICGKIPDEKEMSFITFIAQKMKVPVIFSPACYVKLLPGNINGDNSFHPVSTFVGRKKDLDEFLIRCLDISGSISMLLFSLPLCFLCSLLIKITSEGPVIYKQKRVGKDGKVFTLYKFRTMINNAEKQIGPVWAEKNDPRVTRIGRIMRETRLDEFPQLINVIRGEMSLVGPRPERPFFVLRHKPLMEIRLAVKPGLTGLAQIRNSYDLHPKHKIKYDYLYIQQRSLMLNLYILAKTVPVILLKKGR